MSEEIFETMLLGACVALALSVAFAVGSLFVACGIFVLRVAGAW